MLPSEYQEQLVFVQWLELNSLTFTAIPNSTYTPSMKQKVQNRRMGLRPGFPDMVVAIPQVGLLCVELKRQKRGVVSPTQKEWIETLNTLPGVEARVCKGADEAIAFVQEYLPATVPTGTTF